MTSDERKLEKEKQRREENKRLGKALGRLFLVCCMRRMSGRSK